MLPNQVVEKLRTHHRKRRFAMKVQQKLDRALESFVRENATDWHPSMSEAERATRNKRVEVLIEAARNGKGDDPMAALIATEVEMTDRARAFADEQRKANEKAMEKLAKALPVYGWCEAVKGLGALGVATVIAEAGDLSGYADHSKLWKRLGFAPYEGLAGSSWKRERWRPRALTKDEWIANPFNGERYALIHQIAVWLRNAQCEAKEKSGTPYGRPKGRYGELYVYRREHTAQTHPEWSDGHAHMDALRYMTKRLIRDLWQAWRDAERGASEQVPEGQTFTALPPQPIEAKAIMVMPIMASDGLPTPQPDEPAARGGMTGKSTVQMLPVHPIHYGDLP